MQAHPFGPIENQLIVGYYKRGRLDPNRVKPVLINIKHVPIPFPELSHLFGVAVYHDYQVFGITNGKELFQDFRVVTETDFLADNTANLLSRGLGYRITFTKHLSTRPATSLFAGLESTEFQASVSLTDMFGIETYRTFCISTAQLEEYCEPMGYYRLKNCIEKYQTIEFEHNVRYLKVILDGKDAHSVERFPEAPPSPKEGLPLTLKWVCKEFKPILGDVVYETLPNSKDLTLPFLFLMNSIARYIVRLPAESQIPNEAGILMLKCVRIFVNLTDVVIQARGCPEDLAEVKQSLVDISQSLTEWNNRTVDHSETLREVFTTQIRTFRENFSSQVSELAKHLQDDLMATLVVKHGFSFGGCFFLESTSRSINPPAVESNGISPLDNLVRLAANAQLSTKFPSPKIYCSNNYSILDQTPISVIKAEPSELSVHSEGRDPLKLPANVKGNVRILPESDVLLFMSSENDSHEIKMIDLQELEGVDQSGGVIDDRFVKILPADPNLEKFDVYATRSMMSYSGLYVCYSGDPMNQFIMTFKLSHLPLKVGSLSTPKWAHLDLTRFFSDSILDKRPKTAQIRESKRTRKIFFSHTYQAVRLNRLDNGKMIDFTSNFNVLTISFFCCKYNPKNEELQYVAHKWLDADFFWEDQKPPKWHDTWVETSQAMYCCLYYLPQTKIYVVRYHKGQFVSVGRNEHNDLRYFDFGDGFDEFLPLQSRNGLSQMVGIKKHGRHNLFATLSFRY